MKATIVFACATVLGMIFAAAGAESEAEKASERPPCLIYRPEDRDRIRKRLHFERGVWNPTAQPRTQGQTVKYLCEAWSRNYEETLKRHGMTAEGGNPGAHGRSNAMVDVALLVWIEPSLVRPYEPNVDCTTALERAKILDYVRIGVEEITVPKERNRDFFPDPNGRNDRPGDWGHFLDAGWLSGIMLSPTTSCAARKLSARNSMMMCFKNIMCASLMVFSTSSLSMYARIRSGTTGENTPPWQ